MDGRTVKEKDRRVDGRGKDRDAALAGPALHI